MIIQTRNAWQLIFLAVRKEFENTLTVAQKDDFVKFCDKKFSQGYKIQTKSMGDTQTAVGMMLEYCKTIGVVEWKTKGGK